MKNIFTLFVLIVCSPSLFAQSRGLNFDGTNDIVSIPESASLPSGTAMTIELWFNPGSGGAVTQMLISKGMGNYYALYTDGGWLAGSTVHFDIVTVSSGVNGIAYVLPSGLTGTWHHIAGTYDGATIKLYFDGALVSSGSGISGAIATEAGSPLVLGDFSTSGYPYKGTIDEVRIWNVARTAAEISGSRNTEIVPTTTGLVAYYKFNQGTPGGNNAGITTLNDFATTPHNGTLSNFALTGATSNWIAGYPGLTTLPVRFASFTTGREGNSINLAWKTSLQREITSFEVERSADGRSFTTIGSVPARVTGGDEQSYQYTDKLPMRFVNYYRLKAVETSGKVAYSKAVIIRMDAVTTLSVFPNPANGVLQLQTTQQGHFTVQIQDAAQRIVKTLQLTSNGSSLVTPVDVSTLQKGIYFLHAGNDIVKFVKQ